VQRQRRLADAGFAAEHANPDGSAGPVGQIRVQGGEFGVPTGEVLAGVRQLSGHDGAESLVQLPQSPARFDAELPSGGGVDLQRLRGTAAGVQGQHQLLGQPFPVRVLGDEPAQLGNQGQYVALRQFRVEQLLQRRQPALVQPGVVHKGLGAAAQRRALPQRQCLAKAALLDQPVEQVEVELAGPDGDEITAGLPANGVRAEQLAQPGDVDLHLAAHGRRRTVAPDQLAQPPVRHNLVGVQQKRGQHRSRLGAAERPVLRGDLTQHPVSQEIPQT